MVMGHETGIALVKDPRIRAAAFTGSLRGGRALFDLAVSRPEPIPFYGELGSVNPGFVTPEAGEQRADDVAAGFVGSMSLETASFAPSLDCCSFRQVPALRTASRPWPKSGPWRRC